MNKPLSAGESLEDQSSSDLPRLTVEQVIEMHGLEEDEEALRDIARFVTHDRIVVKSDVEKTFEDAAAHISIQYDNGETIEGDLLGIRPEERRPVVIWAPPFGMEWDAGLRRLYIKKARMGTPAIAMCFNVARPREATTFSRYCQDLLEVLGYVKTLPSVDPNLIGLAGISYSCNVVIKIAAEDESIHSVFCLLPSLDIIEMLNKFRLHSHDVSDAIQRFARAEYGWRYADWLDPW